MIGIRNQILVGVVLAVVIGSALAYAVFIYLPSQPGAPVNTWISSGSTISGGNCSQNFPNTLPVAEYSQNKSIVFLTQPNSTAQICVTYRVQKADLMSAVSYPIFQAVMLKLQLQCTTNSCAGSGTPGNFTITTSPAYVTIYPGNSIAKVIIVYTIQAGIYSKGFYGFQYLNAFCPRNTPFAVGYNSSQVNASDFSGYFTHLEATGCNNPNDIIGYEDYLSYGNITGISNLSYVYIPVNYTSP
ncbi:MAG: hypothetical protein PXY39_12565 [archaeon]|nr:hypothetical protein [archaeon]